MTEARPDSRRTGIALIAIAMVIGGTIGPAQVLLGDAVGPATLAALRHLLGGLILVALALHRPAAFRVLTTARVWPLVLVTGVLSAGYQFSFLKAVALTGGAVGTVLAVATVPLFTGIAAYLVQRTRPGARWIVGSLLAAAGSALLLLPGAGSRADPLGVVFGVLAGGVFAGYTMLTQRLSVDVPDAYVSAGVTMLVGGVVLTPALIGADLGAAGPRVMLVVGWLGLVATGAVYALYTRGLQSVPAPLAGTLSLGEPLAATVLSTVVLGERLTAVEWAAGAVIMGGLVTASLHRPAPVIAEVSVRAVGVVRMRAIGVVPMPLAVPVVPVRR